MAAKASKASLSGLLPGKELCSPTALLHQGGLANVDSQEYCCCCGGCHCDVHSGSGTTSDATLWRADLARTSQEGHCSGGGGSPEEQLFCRHYRRGHWRVRGSYGSARQHPAWIDSCCRRKGAHGGVIPSPIQGI